MNAELIEQFTYYYTIREIIEFEKRVERFNKSLIQKKYHNSEKGYIKMQHNNEKRRNKTKFKKCIRELNNTFEKINIIQ